MPSCLVMRKGSGFWHSCPQVGTRVTRNAGCVSIRGLICPCTRRCQRIRLATRPGYSPDAKQQHRYPTSNPKEATMGHNKLRELLNADRPTIGTHLHATWPSIVEVVGHTGMFDYVEFCAEYAPFD